MTSLDPDCPRCGCPAADHPIDERGVRTCSVGIDDLPSCRSCRARLEEVYGLKVARETHEQAMLCLHCGVAGVVPPEHFPQAAGRSRWACPQCRMRSVWLAEPSVRLFGIHPARMVEDYLAELFKRGNRRARGANA